MTSSPPPALRAVLFDFDHTLAHLGTHVRWDDARKELLPLYETAGVPHALLEETPGALHLYQQIGASRPLPPDRLDEVQRAASRIIEAYETEAIPHTHVEPEVRACLGRLRRLGLRLGLVTSNARSVVLAILELEGLVNDFWGTVTRDDVRALKPSPEAVLMACAALDVSPAQCVVAGDSGADIEAGRAAGTAAYGLSGGVATSEELREAGALEVFDSLARLCDAVAKLAPSEVR